MSSFGEELRRERELRQITLREVADATKINLRYLEALDKNDFKHLPGGVFNRGFVRAYAQYIGIDPDQMVSAYLLEELAQSKKKNSGVASEALLRGSKSRAGTETRGTPTEGSGRWLKVGLAVLIVAAVIAGTALVYFKLFGSESGPEDLPSSGPPQSQSAPGSKPELEPVQPEQPGVDGRATDTTADELASRNAPDPSPPPASVETSSPGLSAPAVAATAIPSVHSLTARRPRQVTIYIDRATRGRVNCDDRQIDLLNGMPAGTRFELSCSAFLIVDADDGGALRIGWPGVAPTAPGEAGVALAGHRIEVLAMSDRADAGNQP